MDKMTHYLNDHLLGEATDNVDIRKKFARDGSILNIIPEMIVSPRDTDDIRKINRLAWQLAEKKHILPITVRGGGSDKTGAAIGFGVIINTTAHLNNILFINDNPKDTFVHVQSGVNVDTLDKTLQAKGLSLPIVSSSSRIATVGGLLANNASGVLSGKYGLAGDWVKRLEVVLANGDLIEVARISKRELSKKKGLQTLEGELYRKIDGIIEDNEQLIADKIVDDVVDNTGYSGIGKVKRKDGSFDLTPLIVGSQGTLATITEAVIGVVPRLKTSNAIMIATFGNAESARDTADWLASNLQPTRLEMIDGELFDEAKQYGKTYCFSSADEDIKAVLYIDFSDPKEHIQKTKIKKALRQLNKTNANVYTMKDCSAAALASVREVSAFLSRSTKKNETMPEIINGASIPLERREEFLLGLAELAKKHLITFPFYVQWLTGVFHVYPTLNLHKTSDKQKALRIIKDYVDLVVRYGGSISAESAEGRLKTLAAYEQMDDDVLDLYTQIKEAFDPYNILNPGVKQKNSLKDLAEAIDSGYDAARFAEFFPID